MTQQRRASAHPGRPLGKRGKRTRGARINEASLRDCRVSGRPGTSPRGQPSPRRSPSRRIRDASVVAGMPSSSAAPPAPPPPARALQRRAQVLALAAPHFVLAGDRDRIVGKGRGPQSRRRGAARRHHAGPCRRAREVEGADPHPGRRSTARSTTLWSSRIVAANRSRGALRRGSCAAAARAAVLLARRARKCDASSPMSSGRAGAEASRRGRREAERNLPEAPRRARHEDHGWWRPRSPTSTFTVRSSPPLELALLQDAQELALDLERDSPTSSRSSVPPSAATEPPARSLIAPVKPPSRAEARSRTAPWGTAAQLTLMRAPLGARAAPGGRWDLAAPGASFPVPDSPVTSTPASVGATCRSARRRTARPRFGR